MHRADSPRLSALTGWVQRQKMVTLQGKRILSFLSLLQRGYSQSDHIQHRFPLTTLEKKRTMKAILKPEHKTSQYEKRGDLQDRDFQGHGRPAALSGTFKCSKETQTENKQKSKDLYLPASQDYSVLQPYQHNISLRLF